MTPLIERLWKAGCATSDDEDGNIERKPFTLAMLNALRPGDILPNGLRVVGALEQRELNLTPKDTPND